MSLLALASLRWYASAGGRCLEPMLLETPLPASMLAVDNKPRWFDPMLEFKLEEPRPAADTLPMLIVLPGADGSAITAWMQYPELALDYELHALRIPPGDRSSHEDLVELVSNEVASSAADGSREVFLLGESLGTGVAIDVALDSPHLLAGLLLVSPATGWNEKWTYSILKWRGSTLVSDDGAWPAVLRFLVTLSSYELLDANQIFSTFRRVLTGETSHLLQGEARNEYAWRVVKDLPARLALDSAAVRHRVSWAEPTFAAGRRANELTVPTLCVAGTADLRVPAESEVRRIKREAPDGLVRCVLVDGAGHAGVTDDRLNLRAEMAAWREARGTSSGQVRQQPKRTPSKFLTSEEYDDDGVPRRSRKPLQHLQQHAPEAGAVFADIGKGVGVAAKDYSKVTAALAVTCYSIALRRLEQNVPEALAVFANIGKGVGAACREYCKLAAAMVIAGFRLAAARATALRAWVRAAVSSAEEWPAVGGTGGPHRMSGPYPPAAAREQWEAPAGWAKPTKPVSSWYDKGERLTPPVKSWYDTGIRLAPTGWPSFIKPEPMLAAPTMLAQAMAERTASVQTAAEPMATESMEAAVKRMDQAAVALKVAALKREGEAVVTRRAEISAALKVARALKISPKEEVLVGKVVPVSAFATHEGEESESAAAEPAAATAATAFAVVTTAAAPAGFEWGMTL